VTGWVGVDPGARESGVVARAGARLVAWRVIDRHVVEPGTEEPGIPTLETIVATIAEFLDLLRAGPSRVAVERAKKPNPHLGMIDVGYLLGTREVIGYVRCAYPGAVLIDPAKNGRQPLITYPRELISPGEIAHADRARTWHAEPGDSASHRHVRSAWDLAGRAPVEALAVQHARPTPAPARRRARRTPAPPQGRTT